MEELIFSLLGGTAILVLGIEMLGEGLERAAGNAMRRILNKLTSSLMRGIGLGTAVTAIIQSSTATTVMVVGFVNAGMMTLEQALGVIYGANIGTTMTNQLLRLEITGYAMPIIGIGVIMKLLVPGERWRNIGTSVIGFGLLFLGLTTLSSGSVYVQSNPDIVAFMETYASNLYISVFIGVILTGVLQASSATTGLVVALAQVGLLDIYMAAAITLGNNIGTCGTALLASVGTNKAAQRAAWGHTLFNIAGVVLVLPVFYPFVDLIVTTSDNIIGQIANLHTIFNIASTVLFIPINSQFAKLLYKLVPGDDSEITPGVRHLDKLLLETPDAAIEATYLEMKRANDVASRMYHNVYDAVQKESLEALKTVAEDEEILNDLQREITRYMVELARRDLDVNQSSQIPDLLHMIGDLERIGDHAFAMVEHVEKKITQDIAFSETASNQLAELVDGVHQLSVIVQHALEHKELEDVEQGKVIERRVKTMTEAARQGHIERLEHGLCSVEAGIYFLDIISHYERIAEHLRNIILSTVHRRSDLVK